MSRSNSTRARRGAPPVCESDLSLLVRLAHSEMSFLPHERQTYTLLTAALNELQQRRAADANRTAGLARRMRRQRDERADYLFGEAGGRRYYRDASMRKAREARASGLPPEDIRAHVESARASNHAALRLRREARKARESAREVRP